MQAVSQKMLIISVFSILHNLKSIAVKSDVHFPVTAARNFMQITSENIEISKVAVVILDRAEDGAAYFDVDDQPTKPSASAADAEEEDNWDESDTESELPEQQSRKVSNSHCGLHDSVGYLCF